jgi:hypothetical protein
MKKITSACGPLLQANLIKKLLLTCIASFTVLSSFAVSKTISAGNWSVAGNWTPAGLPTSADSVTILGTVSMDQAAATCASLTIAAAGKLTLNNNITVSGNWSNSGTFTSNSNTVTMSGNGNTTMGGSSASSFYNLTINTPGATNIVALANSNISLQSSGTLTLQNGIFKIGAANSMAMGTGTAFTITAVNGKLANSLDGSGIDTDADGGSINVTMSFSQSLTVNGNVTFNNIYSLGLDGNWRLDLKGTADRINGTLKIPKGGGSNQWAITSNSPIWGPASTFFIDKNTATYAPGLEWTVDTLGVIGVTPGYPNNVTIVDIGTSSGNNAPGPTGPITTGWSPTGTVGLNGTLQIGDGTIATTVGLHDVKSFTSGGIVVDKNSILVGPPTKAPFLNTGNFTLQGSTTTAGLGVFYDYGATMNFGGSGTAGSPQIISSTDLTYTIPFTTVKISNGTYVKLNNPITIGSALNLASGYIGTTSTNSLTVINPASTAVSGGGPGAYIDGPLSWGLPATSVANYVFPIGDHAAGAYLPLTFTTPNSTSGTTVTAQAFDHNSGGSPGPTVTSLSTTEYWSVSTTNPFNGATQVTAQRPSLVSPNNSLASSTSAAGVYKAIGGSPNSTAPGIISGGGIGSGSPVYIVMAQAPLGVIKIGGTNAGLDASCNPTNGSLLVGGTGGTAPYSYSITGAAPADFGAVGANSFPNLSKGSHQVWVKDAIGNIATAFLQVLGSLLINGDNQDVDICTGKSTTLSASNLLNNNASYTWTSSPATAMLPNANSASITVSPTVNPTTYTLSSTIFNPNANLVVNGGFESGDVTATINSTYNDYTGNAQYASTPGNNGYYSITTAGTTLCQWFSISGPANAAALIPQEGTKYFVADGQNTGGSKVAWSQTVATTSGVTYQFSFYYASASISSPHSVLQTAMTNGTLTGIVNDTASNSSGWTRATGTFASTGSSSTISISNIISGIGGNDFYLDNIQLLPPCTLTQSINVTINCIAPVDYTDFNVVKQGAGALLTWGTANEENSAYFMVEKSTDGISFEPIGKVTAAGNSLKAHRYTFTDPSISSGITYYRLAQYDINGEVHYSVIKVVSKEGISNVQVVPNPNNGTFAVIFDNAGEVKSQISVFNALGQVVYEGSESITNYKSVDISQLASGIYYLHVSTQAENVVKKIIKE